MPDVRDICPIDYPGSIDHVTRSQGGSANGHFSTEKTGPGNRRAASRLCDAPRVLARHRQRHRSAPHRYLQFRGFDLGDFGVGKTRRFLAQEA